jgi:large subunit ribosomal protein L29
MAKNKKQDLTALSDDNLQNEILDNQTRLQKMKFSHAITPIENPLSIRDIRRTVAKLKTEQHRRALN